MTKTKLTERQIQVGAKYLVASDTGRMLQKRPLLTEPEILAILARIDQDYAAQDQAVFALRHYDHEYFMRELRAGDAHYIGVLQENLPWLFDEAEEGGRGA